MATTVTYLEQTCFTEALPPGTYWPFVTTSTFSRIPRGVDYVATVTETTTPADTLSWGTIKAMYR